jgi:transcriptional regulator with XRE-family HTH domain
MQLQQLLGIADSGVALDPLPTGAEARAIRTRSDVSPTVLAAVVGVSDRTLLRYERDTNGTIASLAARLRLGRVLRSLASDYAATVER